MNYNMYQQKYSGKVIAAEEKEVAESMSWYLLVHLFVNIVSQLNLMRQYCGLDQKKNHTLLQAKQDLRNIEYAFNYFFLFLKSLGLEKVIESIPRNFQIFSWIKFLVIWEINHT